MSFDIERYLNIRTGFGGTVGPRGEQLAFLLDTTGVPQLWSLEGPQGWPEQRTFYDERVTFADFSPTRDEIAFGMDDGGNERVQLFLIDSEETVTALTGIPDAKHRWGGWSHDGDRFAFASNRRDASVFDIYVQGREQRGDDATLIHKGDGWLSVAGWSPSDDRLIVHEAHASYDHDLYVLDINTGDIEHVTPHAGDVRYSSPEWGPDGDALYVCTDEETDTLSLARLDLETGDFQTVVDGGDWNVDTVTIDQDSERLVYSRNVDGNTELCPGEFKSPKDVRTFPEPDLPHVSGGIDFDPNGETFAVTATGRSMNANVYVVDIESGNTDRWTNASTAGIPRETFVDPTLVHYESFDGLQIPAFFSLPPDVQDTAGETPVIVDIHGGPESQRRPSFRAITQYFLDHGYAVFEPNVRGSSGYGSEYTHLDDVRKRMDSVKDIRAGVDWLCKQPAVDEDHIVALGGSYGGFMVLAALTEYPDLWAAGVDIVGIANFVTFLENTGDWRRELREAEYGSLEEDRAFLEEISPVNNIENIAAPLFVAHGANDPRVPVGEAEQIARETEAQGIPVETLIFEDEGHGFTKLENRIEAYSRIVEFLDEHA